MICRSERISPRGKKKKALGIFPLKTVVAAHDKEKGAVVGSEEFVAGASIPISCLRRGIRSVKLFDANNTRSGPFDFASLLVDIKIERATPEV